MLKLIVKSLLCGAFCHVGSVLAKDIIDKAKDPYYVTPRKIKWQNFKEKIFRRN